MNLFDDTVEAIKLTIDVEASLNKIFHDTAWWEVSDKKVDYFVFRPDRVEGVVLILVYQYSDFEIVSCGLFLLIGHLAIFSIFTCRLWGYLATRLVSCYLIAVKSAADLVRAWAKAKAKNLVNMAKYHPWTTTFNASALGGGMAGGMGGYSKDRTYAELVQDISDGALYGAGSSVLGMSVGHNALDRQIGIAGHSGAQGMAIVSGVAGAGKAARAARERRKRRAESPTSNP